MDLPPAIELVDAELGTGGADVLAKLLTDKGFADDVEQHAAASASAFTYADEREP